jgi:uncharacterized protein
LEITTKEEAMTEERDSVEMINENSVHTRYEIELDGYLAYLEYRLDNGCMDLFHTYSPKELSGRGVASRLVAFALNKARERKLNIRPTCSFVEAYIKNHPEFSDVVG